MYSQQYDGYMSSSEIQLIPNVGYILVTNNKQDTKKSKLLFIAYLFSELLINEMKSSLEARGSIDSILPHK